MNTQITIEGKRLGIQLSRRAEQALSQRQTPLITEMELYFSCLVRKQVRFHEGADNLPGESVAVNDRLRVRFRPVMTHSCHVDEIAGKAPPLTDFPVVNAAAFVPHWLRIDYRNGQWRGEFGYC